MPVTVRGGLLLPARLLQLHAHGLWRCRLPVRGWQRGATAVCGRLLHHPRGRPRCQPCRVREVPARPLLYRLVAVDVRRLQYHHSSRQCPHIRLLHTRQRTHATLRGRPLWLRGGAQRRGLLWRMQGRPMGWRGGDQRRMCRRVCAWSLVPRRQQLQVPSAMPRGHVGGRGCGNGGVPRALQGRVPVPVRVSAVRGAGVQSTALAALAPCLTS